METFRDNTSEKPDFIIARQLASEDPDLSKDSITNEVLTTEHLPNGSEVGDIGDFLADRKSALVDMPDAESAAFKARVKEAMGEASKPPEEEEK